MCPITFSLKIVTVLLAGSEAAKDLFAVPALV
jgi:hypothetical protein